MPRRNRPGDGIEGREAPPIARSDLDATPRELDHPFQIFGIVAVFDAESIGDRIGTSDHGPTHLPGGTVVDGLIVHAVSKE
jgi:hypothetical protein